MRSSLHRTEIGLLERGARVPRIDTLIKIASALPIPPAELIEGHRLDAGQHDDAAASRSRPKATRSRTGA